jgi:hypothetical protein
MAVPTTNISLHLITAIQAIDHASFGQPMILRLETRYGATELTFFFEDEGLTKRLVEAINDAVKAVKPLDACPHEAAAYSAAAYAYGEAR